jgi:hypothetical protein
MKRYIVKFSNGLMQQQEGINITYHHLCSIGVVDWIIDTHNGTISMGNKEHDVKEFKISEYSGGDLIIEKKK